MKRFLGALIATLTLTLAISCTTSHPVAVNGDIGSKRGESTGQIICGLIFLGNGDILDAAKNGGITHVSTVDIRTTNILGGLYIKSTTIVSGE